MSAPNVADLATSLVTVAPSPASSGTTLAVTPGEDDRFPSTPFDAIVHPALELPTIDNAEIVIVTDNSSGVFTIVRAQGVTSAKEIAVGWRISNAILSSHIRGAYGSGYHYQDGPTTVGLYVYVGFEHENDGSWYIYRRTIATGVRQYARGTSDYADAWTNKTGLTYS